MFDIRDYYSRYGHVRDNGDNETDIGDIEDDISMDIDNLLKSRFSPLYVRDKYKRGPACIDIIYPRMGYPMPRSLIKGPDHVRFLLSRYPRPGDLENFDKIVMKPRHVQMGDIELVALYIRKKRILVQYLHHPYLYDADNSKFNQYSEYIPFEDAGFVIREAGVQSQIKIPPLWYIISIVAYSPDNKIDKFFYRKDINGPDRAGAHLDEISFYYARHGY